jgi:hypothetical protein
MVWLDTVTDVALRSDLIDQTLGYIPQDKPDDLMRQIKKLPASTERDQRISSHFSSWADDDPNAALAWLKQHDEPELATARRQIEGMQISNLAQTDLHAALARWQSLPADAMRNDVSGQIATTWAKTDPAAATRWLAQQMPPSPEIQFANRQNASQILTVASRWAHQDPLAYLTWSETLSNEALRSSAAEVLMYNYTENSDPPPRATYASQLARIQDPALRERVLTWHLSEWLSTDVRAARAWIESNDAISPEAAAKLLTQTESSRN